MEKHALQSPRHSLIKQNKRVDLDPRKTGLITRSSKLSSLDKAAETWVQQKTPDMTFLSDNENAEILGHQ